MLGFSDWIKEGIIMIREDSEDSNVVSWCCLSYFFLKLFAVCLSVKLA